MKPFDVDLYFPKLRIYIDSNENNDEDCNNNKEKERRKQF